MAELEQKPRTPLRAFYVGLQNEGAHAVPSRAAKHAAEPLALGSKESAAALQAFMKGYASLQDEVRRASSC